MTKPPFPASPCIRVALGYRNGDSFDAGSRFYLSYSGAAPSAANCSTLATDIASAWATSIAPNISSVWSLVEVDVLDIATDSGASATVAVSHAGGGGSDAPTANTAINVEFGIARRYRGGKPRMFFPAAPASELADNAHWSAAFQAAFNTSVSAWMTAIEALSVGSIGTLQHVNLSYYESFTNVTNSSGRTRAAPKYRAVALLDTITGYTTKAVVGSQRRRRVATTI